MSKIEEICRELTKDANEPYAWIYAVNGARAVLEFAKLTKYLDGECESVELADLEGLFEEPKGNE